MLAVGYEYEMEGFMTREEDSRWSLFEPSQELQRKKEKRKVSEGCKGRLDCERRMKKTNERKFVMMGEMKDEALSAKREKKKKQPTAYAPGS